MFEEEMTLSKWMDTWIAEFCPGVTKNTRVTYRQKARTYIKPALGAVPLSDVTRVSVQTFVKALQQATEIGLIKLNPATACKLPRVEKPKIRPLEDDGIEQFLSAIRGHENERAMIVALFAGVRQGELLGLPRGSVDFANGTILLYRQLQHTEGSYELVPLKNGKIRRITPAPFVMDALREQRRKQAEWKLRAGKTWMDGDFVFTNEIGEHLKGNTLYKRFKRVIGSIGIPEMRFHDLRHTYAVSSLRAGDDLKTLQENLGHATAAFTLDQYAHVTESMKRESANRMQAFIQGLKTDK